MTLPESGITSKTMKSRRFLVLVSSHAYFPIFLLLAINIVIGWLVFPAYGESWDEQLRFQYGERSLAAYSGNARSLIDEKGAFYVMAARLGSDVIRWLQPALKPIQAWHFIHFLAFLLGVFFLYRICLKFVGKWPAFGAAVLFNTQPLLWGHAFINPKDIPFMSFFLGSVALGIEMADSLALRQSDQEPVALQGGWQEFKTAIKLDRDKVKRPRQVIYLCLAALSLALLLGLVLGAGPLRVFLAGQIEQAASPQARGLLSQIFNRVAENRSGVPVEQYIEKSYLLLNRFTTIFSLLAVLFVGFCLVRVFSGAAYSFWQSGIKPFFHQVGRSLKDPKVWLAGIFLGLCTSIRVLGPASALLVGLYFLIKARWKALPVLMAYSGIALLVLYLTWPYLWGAPISNFLHSLNVASDYPWEGKVRFAGIDYPVSTVPRSFLPALILFQTPEASLLLFLLGTLAAIYAARSKKLDSSVILLAALWFWIPILSTVLFQPTLYDNFRQFLFIIPAAYLFIAIGLWFVFGFIKSTGWKLLLLFALALPNLVALIQLHPYQYIYYNSLVGGVSGAFREYETDYWATSYRAATEYLNQAAPPGATVLVLGPSQLISHYGRADLNIQEYSPQKTIPPDYPFYVVLYTRYDKDRSLFPNAPEQFRVERNGAVLVVVKRVEPN